MCSLVACPVRRDLFSSRDQHLARALVLTLSSSTVRLSHCHVCAASARERTDLSFNTKSKNMFHSMRGVFDKQHVSVAHYPLNHYVRNMYVTLSTHTYMGLSSGICKL